MNRTTRITSALELTGDNLTLDAAEHILHGRYRSLDLSDLGHERILAGRPLREANII